MTTNICNYGRWFLVVFCVAALFSSSFSAAVTNASVTVVRSDNNKPLNYAIVKVFPLEMRNGQTQTATGFTDQAGLFAYSFTEPVIIQISHLAYGTITDTLYQPEHKSYSISHGSQSIQDVVVTGQYAPNSVKKSVYEIKVINAEMIRAKGANNLREALQNELGIDLGQDQVFGSNISINGISGEGVKIMVDGVPIVGKLDGKIDLSQININNIERIEIVEGPLSVVYGTDAMGGVINIITKSFQAEKVNINLKGYYETAGQYNLELNGGFAFNKSQIYLSGGRNFFDGYSPDKSLTRFQDWKPKEQYFADAKYIFTGNKIRFSLAASFLRELLLDRGEPRRTLNDSLTAWTYIADDAHFLTYRPRASASVMYRFKENTQLDVLLAYSGFFRFSNIYSKNMVTLHETMANDTLQDTAHYHQIVFRSTYSMPAWKYRLNFQLGVDVNQEYTLQERVSGGIQKLGDYAAFGSVRINLIEGLDIQPAVRFSYNTKFRVPLIPSINIRYNFKDKLVLRTSYGRGYRAPSLKELYLSFVDINHNITGNENLKPEDGHSVNASFSYTHSISKLHSIVFGVSGFFNDIFNKIDLEGSGNTFRYFNLKKYTTYGGDVSLVYNWKKLQVRTATQFTRYELSRTTNKNDVVRTYSPDFAASAIYLIPKAEISLSIIYKYNGQKPLFSISNSYQTGTRYAFHSLDVSLSRNFWKDRIQLTVGGKNLTDVKNVQQVGVSSVGHNTGSDANIGWGRTFFTSLVLHFSK